jgi:putative ABC transport system permease protein
MNRLFSVLRRWLNPRATEKALDDEIHAYLQHDIDAKIRAGMSPEEAHRQSRVELGGIEPVKEHTRQARTGAGLDGLVQDVRYALRTLTQAAGFSFSIIGSLSLGIAAVVAAFAFINGWVLRPLPGVQNQERLVEVEVQHQGCDFASCLGPIRTSLKDYEFLRQGLPSFSGLAASTSDQVSVRLPEPRSLRAEFVSENFFAVLQLRPAIGRADIAGGAVLSHSLWLREFGGDPAAVGKSIYVANQRIPIVGVAPPDFAGLHIPIGAPGTMIWLPMALANENSGFPAGELYRDYVGRLKEGVEMPQLQTEASILAAQLLASRGLDATQGRAALLEPGKKGVMRKSAIFTLILPVPILVLLLACLNGANLLLARASRRNREIAIRLAIGASRWRVVRQLLMESLMLAAAAGVAAIPLAWAALKVASVYLLLPMPIDLTVLLVALITVGVSAIGFGLAPAFRVTRKQPARALGASQASTDALPERMRGRRILVIAQVTLSLGLLASATQLVSAIRSWDRSTGTPADRLLLAAFDLDQLKFPEADARAFYERAVANVSRLPGVEKVGLASLDSLWAGRRGKGPDAVVAWLPTQTSRQGAIYLGGYVGGDLFDALGLRVIQGEGFTAGDKASSRPSVVIVNRPFAELVLGGDAVGKTIWVNARDADDASAIAVRVAGVVEPVVHPSYSKGRPVPGIYLPSPLRAESARALYIQARGSADSIKAAVRATIRQIDPKVPFVEFASLAELNEQERLPHTGMAGAAAILGIVALLLATSGLYAVVSYIMSMRTREIAIRLALGAERRAVFHMIFRQAMKMIVIGSVLGAGIAFAASQVIRSQAEGVRELDKLAFGGSILLLLIPTVLASSIPALRAMRTDPAKFLRAD